MYDPKTARFLQQDTYAGEAGDPLSLNLYTYCHNEPMMYWDYSGHAEGDWWDIVANAKLTWRVITDKEEREKTVELIETYHEPGLAKNFAINFANNAGYISDKISEIPDNWDRNTKKLKEDIKSIPGKVKSKVVTAKNNVINNSKKLYNGVTKAFDSPESFKSSVAGVVSSIGNGGLNTARVVLTGLSCDPNSTWTQLGSGIDWGNEKLQANFVTDQEAFEAYTAITDAGQMAWGAGGLFKIKGVVRLPNLNSGPSVVDAGTGIRMNPYGIPNDFGRMRVSLTNPNAGVRGGKPEVFVRYGSEAEALASKEAGGLVPKIQNGNPTRGGKWISEKAQPRDVAALGKPKYYTHEMTIEAKPGAKQWLESKGINYEDMIGGESKNASSVFLKYNEPGSYGVGADLVKEFNNNWVTKVTYRKIR